jgi:hypothetical protein
VNITGTSAVSGTVSVSGAIFDGASNLMVDLATALPSGGNVIGSIANTNFAVNNLPAVQTVSILASSSLPAGVNPLGSVNVTGTSAVSGSVSVIGQTYDGNSNLNVNLETALPSGGNIIGEVGINPALNGVQISAGPGFAAIAPLFVQTAEVSGGVGTLASNPEFVELVAGSAIAGQFGIDQTTSGVTNGVVINMPLPEGTNALGSVIVTGTSLVSGTVAVDNFPVDQVVHLSEPIPAGSALIGIVGIDQVTSGANDINVLNLPAVQTVSIAASSMLPEGTNSLGTVGLNTGSNAIGSVDVTNTVAVSGAVSVSGDVSVAGQTYDGASNLNVNLETSLPTGSNAIGSVSVSNTVAVSGAMDQAGLWNVGLNAGTANIGGVELVDAGGVNKASISADGAQLVALDPTVTNTVALSGGFGSSNANPLFIEIASGDAGTVQNSGQITSATAIAPAGNVIIPSVAITSGKVGSLEHVVMSSASQMRYDLGYIDNGGTSHVQYTMFSSSSNLNTEFKPSIGSEFALPAADGANAKFYVSATNMDTVNTNDAYVTFCWIEV